MGPVIEYADELKKLEIEPNPTTVNRIIQTFRKKGMIQPTGGWKKFLRSHWDSLFGMDFMTIDTLFGRRFSWGQIIHPYSWLKTQ